MAASNVTIDSFELTSWGAMMSEDHGNCFELSGDEKTGWVWFITYSDGVCISNWNVGDVMRFCSAFDAFADMMREFESGIRAA